jgi:hypothetical protein
MPTYEFRYEVVESWKATFVAESIEHAKALLQQLADDEIDTDDLPEYSERNKGIESDYSNSVVELGFGVEPTSIDLTIKE